MTTKRSLRVVLLVQLAFLAATALVLGVSTSLLASAFAPERAFPLILAVITVDVAIFIGFGHYLVTRLVLRPLGRLMGAADAVVAGDLAARAPEAETAEFATLAQGFNRMTDHLLNVQDQLVRAEKLASVGRLAAGIAHEIGNPLGGAATFVEVMRRRAAAPDVVEGIERELQRIDRIVRSLLDFASPHEEALQPVSVATVLQTTFALLQSQGAFRGVHPRLDLAPDVPTILGLAHALEQALVNLLLNAVDAAPGGAVVLGAQRWAFEVASARQRRTNDPADMAFSRLRQRRPSRVEFREGQPGALVFVADSGPGVPPQDRDKVFEPFYTTKEPGRGTGLGLAIVARIVYDIGGVVWVDQAREGGAAFKMFFPEGGETGGGSA